MKVDIDKIQTVKDLNAAAKQLVHEAEANLELPENKETRLCIQKNAHDETWLFNYLVKCIVNKNHWPFIYTLANCFNDDSKRNAFIKRESEGNTLYHLAIINEVLNVVIVLTAKNAFPKQKKFIEWTRKSNPNRAGEGPFDTCCKQCKQGNNDIFKILWVRVNSTGKTNHIEHIDEISLGHACTSRNLFIINEILRCIKLLYLPKDKYKRLLNRVESGVFGNKVKNLFLDTFGTEIFSEESMFIVVAKAGPSFFKQEIKASKKRALDPEIEIEDNRELIKKIPDCNTKHV